MSEAPADVLMRLLERRGWNAHRLAVETSGGVSDTAIRNYLKGSRPDAPQLLAMAKVLGPKDGPYLLRAYGEKAMAEHLEEQFANRETVSEAGHPLTADEELSSLQTIRDGIQERLDEIAELVAEFERRIRR